MASSRTRALSPVEQDETRQQRDMAERGRRLTRYRRAQRHELRDDWTAVRLTDTDEIVPVFTLEPRLAA